MKLLDRYLIKELLMPFIGGILAFTIILIGSTVLFELLSDAVEYGIPFNHVMVMLILKLPFVISVSIPIATLFATITVFGRLGNDLEILALRSNGVSLFRLLIPVFFVGLFISAISLWFSEVVVPVSATKSHDLYLTYRDKDVSTIRKNINITEYKNDLPHRIINIGEKDGGNLSNITIAEYEEGQLSRLIRSIKGRWVGNGEWEFFNGIMHYFQKDDLKRVTVIEYEKETIFLNMKPIELENRKKSLEEMNRKEMREKIQFLAKTGKDPTKLIMDMHMKTSIAFSSLIYCFLGAAMGLQPHRSSSAMGMGLSLIVIFIYILLMAIGSWLGLSGFLIPVLAAWFPNFIIGFASIFLVWKIVSN